MSSPAGAYSSTDIEKTEGGECFPALRLMRKTMNILSQTVPIQYDTGFSPYGAAGWREAFADVAKHGLTGVEIAVAYPEKADAALLFNEAEKNGLAITTVSTGQICGLEGQYLTAEDTALRMRAAQTVMRHIGLAERIGRPNVTIGLLRGKPGVDTPAAVLEEMLAQSLVPLCARAKEAGVKLQLEAINRSEASFINSTAQCLAFIERMGAPDALGILYDTYHSYIEDEDMLGAVKAAAGKITNVHLADSHRGLPGEGNIDFQRVCRALRESGYRGAFALETKCVPDREHILRFYAASIKKATA